MVCPRWLFHFIKEASKSNVEDDRHSRSDWRTGISHEPGILTISSTNNNQGGSVAQTFLHLPGWKVRGISRNPASSAAKSLTQAGVEVVRADLDDKDSLLEAFTGANLIFANTDFFMNLFGGAESEDLLQGRTPQQ